MISIVIPTLNEAAWLPALAEQLLEEPSENEIIVIDGGSRDGTVQIARSFGLRVLSTLPGRGRQLAAGAAAATGDVLLFLHADSRFPAGGLAAIRQALSEHPRSPGGNFRLLFDDPEADEFCQWLNGFYSFVRRLGFYYGDSGIFARRKTFDQIGGIKPLALMEDFDLVCRLERVGPTICILEPPLVTSGRRFRNRRRLEILWGWLKIHLLFYLGVSPERLARLYDSERSCERSDV